MSQEDFVQASEVGWFQYSIAGGVLTVNASRGFGALTRTGAGTLRITLPAGKGIDNTRTQIRYMGAGTVMLGCTFNRAASTDTVKDVLIFDNAGAAIDNVDGEISLYSVQPQ